MKDLRYCGFNVNVHLRQQSTLGPRHNKLSLVEIELLSATYAQVVLRLASQPNTKGVEGDQTKEQGR
jgi:hypothetical protein